VAARVLGGGSMAANLVIGVEGGATRTTGVLVEGDRCVIAEQVAGPSNVYAVGQAQALATVTQVLTGLRGDAGERWRQVGASAFCLAGLRADADRAVWRRIVEQAGLGSPVHLTHDAVAGLAAGSPDVTGVLVVSGTGSVVYGRRGDGREHRVGGRGPILGDEGSGFDIGHRALRAAARAADRRGPMTVLAQSIPERLGLDGLDDLIAWLSPFAKDRIAGVAPVVFEAAAGGDAVAGEILAAAARELARGVEAVVARLWPPDGRDGPPRVVLAGGVLRAQPGFRQTLTTMMADLTSGAEVVVPEVSGAVGAARVARLSFEGPGALA